MPSTSTGLAEEIMAPDEAAVVGEFITFLREASARRYPTGVIRRFNQARHSGCVEAEFTVLDTLPPEHRVGLFARPRTFPAFIRFANAASVSDREKDLHGDRVGDGVVRVVRVNADGIHQGGDRAADEVVHLFSQPELLVHRRLWDL